MVSAASVGVEYGHDGLETTFRLSLPGLEVWLRRRGESSDKLN